MVTLGELGNKVPIYLRDGKRPDFTFKPWRMKEEKEVAVLKKTHRQLGKFVRGVFSTMIETFDGKNWSEMKESEKGLLINQMPVGAIMYMYCYLRYDALGENIKIRDVDCPACGQKIENYAGDLTTLEVAVQDDEKDSTMVYDLHRPFVIGEVKVIGLRLRHTPWDAMEKLDPKRAANEGYMKEAMFLSSVQCCVIEGGGDVELDKMKVMESLIKADIEGVFSALDEHNGGPRLALEIVCPHCDHEAEMKLDWDYNFFFGLSSIPKKKKDSLN